ncbi:hypothetical protein [Sphingomonas sp. BE137]|uniref:hypothetical protein n=1 Tax=Sphingomonas sp. BE137 TaxID=2817844 RepID=UPI001AE96C16|nr:hypothetical protein [Sphingomonas sp. BE137]MDR6850342.1 hypothetical protein [Sphingomonas sp. BE137]
MPLHVARLRDSDLAAEGHPEACWYAVLLWSASWHQVPAGSLPTGEAVLARLCGLGRDLKTFRKHRAAAMRGWIECSDGRLYHPVVAEQVNASWSEKLAYRDRKAARKAIAEKAADARWSKCKDGQDADASAMHDASNADASCMANAMPKGRGRGTGSYSDPDGSGAESANEPETLPALPIDPAKLMFDSGIALLGLAAVPERKARSLLGKWLRDHGSERVIVALGAAQREGAIDPTSFIERCLKNGANPQFDRPGDSLRGSRPDPSLDLLRSARRAGEAASASSSGNSDRGAWPPLPAISQG